jgi:two-component system KDP operon response regulator KdpE
MILIADDEPRMFEILKPSLIAQGYPVLEAQGRDDVLQKLRNNRPELILLGVGAAEISGPEVCREIRVGSDVPIIVLTTRSTERDKVMALDAGVWRHETTYEKAADVVSDGGPGIYGMLLQDGIL